MSAKNRDEHNSWRNKTIGFRMTPEEATQLDAAVRLSGITKQDYIRRSYLTGTWSYRPARESTKPCGASSPRCLTS